MKSLQEEADYWNTEYRKCFGEPPVPAIGNGVEMSVVHAIQSAVMRHYVELMKMQIRKHSRKAKRTIQQG